MLCQIYKIWHRNKVSLIGNLKLFSCWEILVESEGTLAFGFSTIQQSHIFTSSVEITGSKGRQPLSFVGKPSHSGFLATRPPADFFWLLSQQVAFPGDLSHDCSKMWAGNVSCPIIIRLDGDQPWTPSDLGPVGKEADVWDWTCVHACVLCMCVCSVCVFVWVVWCVCAVCMFFVWGVVCVWCVCCMCVCKRETIKDRESETDRGRERRCW